MIDEIAANPVTFVLI